MILVEIFMSGNKKRLLIPVIKHIILSNVIVWYHIKVCPYRNNLLNITDNWRFSSSPQLRAV